MKRATKAIVEALNPETEEYTHELAILSGQGTRTTEKKKITREKAIEFLDNEINLSFAALYENYGEDVDE